MLKHCDVRFWLQAGCPISTAAQHCDYDAPAAEQFPELIKSLNSSCTDDSCGYFEESLPELLDSDSSTSTLSSPHAPGIKDRQLTSWHRLVAKSSNFAETQHLLFRLMPYRHHPVFTVLDELERLPPVDVSELNISHDPSTWLLDDMSAPSLLPSVRIGSPADGRDLTWDSALFSRPYLTFTAQDGRRVHEIKQHYFSRMECCAIPEQIDAYLEEVKAGRIRLDRDYLDKISVPALFNINRLLFNYDEDQSPSYSITSDDNKLLMFSRDFSFPNSLKDLQAKVELVADCMRMLPRDFVQSLFLSASQVPLIRWLYSSQQLDWYDEQWIRFEQHFTSQLSSIRLRAENEWRNALNFAVQSAKNSIERIYIPVAIADPRPMARDAKQLPSVPNQSIRVDEARGTSLQFDADDTDANRQMIADIKQSLMDQMDAKVKVLAEREMRADWTIKRSNRSKVLKLMELYEAERSNDFSTKHQWENRWLAEESTPVKADSADIVTKAHQDPISISQDDIWVDLVPEKVECTQDAVELDEIEIEITKDCPVSADQSTDQFFDLPPIDDNDESPVVIIEIDKGVAAEISVNEHSLSYQDDEMVSIKSSGEEPVAAEEIINKSTEERQDEGHGHAESLLFISNPNYLHTALGRQQQLAHCAVLFHFFQNLKVDQHLRMLGRVCCMGDGIFNDCFLDGILDVGSGTMRSLAAGNGREFSEILRWSTVLESSISQAFAQELRLEKYLPPSVLFNLSTYLDRFKFYYQLDNDLESALCDARVEADQLMWIEHLKLVYQLPSPIDLVISEEAVRGFSSLFSQHLHCQTFMKRLERICFLASKLRSRRRFSKTLNSSITGMEIRMKQFCRALTCYIRDIGYYQTFTEFMGRIDALSDSIGSEKSTAWKQWSLERLQTEIDLCVNQMMYRSFCHQIMRPVRILILGIFSTVGQYTDLMENATASMDSVMFERSVWEINRSFSEKRKIFLQLIRSIRDKAKQTGADIGSRQSYLQGTVECLEDLLLRF